MRKFGESRLRAAEAMNRLLSRFGNDDVPGQHRTECLQNILQATGLSIAWFGQLAGLVTVDQC